MGEFNVHPLAPGTSPSATDRRDAAGNPIARTGTGNMVRVTFASAGTYPYFCELHYAGGMVGGGAGAVGGGERQTRARAPTGGDTPPGGSAPGPGPWP
jgi:hypothetical protein